MTMTESILIEGMGEDFLEGYEEFTTKMLDKYGDLLDDSKLIILMQNYFIKTQK